MKPIMGSDAETARRMRLALDVPLLQFLGVFAVDDRDAAAGIELAQSTNVLNGVDALHGGAIATVLETAAYLAILPQLTDDEEAVTHMTSMSYLARPEAGAKLKATGEVLRRSRRLAFVTATLRSGDRLSCHGEPDEVHLRCRRVVRPSAIAQVVCSTPLSAIL